MAYTESTLHSSVYSGYGNHSSRGACCTSTTGMNGHRVPLSPHPSPDLCTARFCHLEAEGSPCLLLSPSILLVLQSREFFIQKPFLAMPLFWLLSAMGKSHCLYLERALGIIMFYRVKNLSPREGKQLYKSTQLIIVRARDILRPSKYKPLPVCLSKLTNRIFFKAQHLIKRYLCSI